MNGNLWIIRRIVRIFLKCSDLKLYGRKGRDPTAQEGNWHGRIARRFELSTGAAPSRSPARSPPLKSLDGAIACRADL